MENATRRFRLLPAEPRRSVCWAYWIVSTTAPPHEKGKTRRSGEVFAPVPTQSRRIDRSLALIIGCDGWAISELRRIVARLSTNCQSRCGDSCSRPFRDQQLALASSVAIKSPGAGTSSRQRLQGLRQVPEVVRRRSIARSSAGRSAASSLSEPKEAREPAGR